MTNLLRNHRYRNQGAEPTVSSYDVTDLTDIGVIVPESTKRSMRPPNSSDRVNYSYQNDIDSNLDLDLGIQILDDNADNDALQIMDRGDRLPNDLEGQITESSLGYRLGGSFRKGQGFTSFTEFTIYPESGRTTTIRKI
ncbi:MAG: hypothetical protein ACRD8Z_03850 [Nitrososphaeraceae archaeon]